MKRGKCSGERIFVESKYVHKSKVTAIYLSCPPLQTMRSKRVAQKPQLIRTSTALASRLAVRCTALVSSRRVAKALSNSNHLQAIVLGPVDQPRRERVDGRSISLVHEGNMAVATGTSLLELLLALLGRLTVPVLGVDVVGDDAVAQVLHRGEYVAAGGEVGRAHVSWLDADDVDERLLQTRHLGCEVVGGEGAEVRGVGPCVRCDLVAGLVGVLEGALLVVNAACVC
jgi:hypothetical protein